MRYDQKRTRSSSRASRATATPTVPWADPPTIGDECRLAATGGGADNVTCVMMPAKGNRAIARDGRSPCGIGGRNFGASSIGCERSYDLPPTQRPSVNRNPVDRQVVHLIPIWVRQAHPAPRYNWHRGGVRSEQRSRDSSPRRHFRVAIESLSADVDMRAYTILPTQSSRIRLHSMSCSPESATSDSKSSIRGARKRGCRCQGAGPAEDRRSFTSSIEYEIRLHGVVVSRRVLETVSTRPLNSVQHDPPRPASGSSRTPQGF